MKNRKNKYGLVREIPEPIKRAVRQRDGFGCVVCGKAIYEYEHIAPKFVDAKEHTVEGIILLCDGCHRKKGRFLAVETILEHAKIPKAKQDGFSFEAFDVGNGPITIEIGPLKATSCASIIKVDGVNLLSVDTPEIRGAPFRLNASLYGPNGHPIFQIVNNEWRTLDSNWDVEVVGPRIQIRSAKGKIALSLRADPPSRLVVERLELLYSSVRIRAKEGGSITVTRGSSAQVASDELSLLECEAAIEISGQRLEVGKRCRIFEGSFTYNRLK